MVVVAVAGGTGNIGRTIVEALQARGKDEIKILSRKPNPDIESQYGVPVIAADYDDVPGLTKILEDNNVHTVISAITMMTFGAPPGEINLIRAADASKVTKRLISSDWGVPHTKEHIGKLPSVIHKLNAQEELTKVTNLETTHFYIGYFLDYWTSPGVKSYMPTMPFAIDIPFNFAAIPGDGNTPVTFIHSTDVAKFVAASLDLDKWDPQTWVLSDTATLNEVLQLAEEAKGTKFTVVYDSVEKLQSGEPTELPSQVPTYAFIPKAFLQPVMASIGLWAHEGLIDLKSDHPLNDRLPDIKPKTVKELLNEAWKKN